jgi:hypothetical protein
MTRQRCVAAQRALRTGVGRDIAESVQGINLRADDGLGGGLHRVKVHKRAVVSRQSFAGSSMKVGREGARVNGTAALRTALKLPPTKNFFDDMVWTGAAEAMSVWW